MIIVDTESLKAYINEIGIKQNVIAAKVGISEPALTMILQGKRELKAGEYASICKVLNTPMTKFVIEKEIAPESVAPSELVERYGAAAPATGAPDSLMTPGA